MSSRRFAIPALCFAILVILLSPYIGARFISPFDVLGVLSEAESMEARIFWTLRIPRVILAWCAGASFGICGMMCQALFRNPLAEPSLLGVSSGAALGAASAIRIGLSGALAIPASAFVGALAAVGIITSFAKIARSTRDATLLLAGIAISALFSSAIMVIQYTGGAAESFRLLSWTMGGISAVGMREGLGALPSLVISLTLAMVYSTELDLITFGDEIAATRGVDLDRTRRRLYAGVSLAVAIVVANCGPIGFLGLIAPHVARRITGPGHRLLAPVTAISGGTALVICDTAARTLWAPADIPVGIIISFLGAPFFLWLLFAPRGSR
ncbi:MAG: iron ABC transporter permease [Synergistaceae bacterium]|jgi:iron complex transport system permease protein|nr:iron ABC transporter permease [Synergistaceae bacterium]